MKKILILVPHHDDEVLGFGGSIAKHVRLGNHVHVAFLRDPLDDRSKKQSKDSSNAQKILGYHLKTDLFFSERELTQFSLPSLNRLENFLSTNSPDILYIPQESDVHQDHHQTLSLTRIATRIWGPAAAPIVLSGEIISSSGNAYKNNFNPQYYEVLSKTDILIKQEALLAYSDEKRQFPHPRSVKGIDVYAEKRGMEAGTYYAEAFEVLRYIQK